MKSIKNIGMLFAMLLATTAFSAGPEYTVDEILDRLDAAGATIEDGYVAADAACDGRGIGAECTIIVDDGVTIGIGICVEIPGPVDGGLTCELNIPKMGCQSFSFADPALGFGLLMMFGLMLYRRRRA